MKKRTIIVLIGMIFIMIMLTGCTQDPGKPLGTLSAAEVLEDPVYDTQIRVYGKVSALRDLMCTCLFLQSGGEKLDVWYDSMVEDNGTVRPSVSVQEINNGDWVVVRGELKSGGDHYLLNAFWAIGIEVIP